MKGVKYNLVINEKNGDKREFEKLTMKEIIEKIKIEFDDIYGWIPKVTSNIIYNICNSRNCNNSILAHKCSIEKV